MTFFSPKQLKFGSGGGGNGLKGRDSGPTVNRGLVCVSVSCLGGEGDTPHFRGSGPHLTSYRLFIYDFFFFLDVIVDIPKPWKFGTTVNLLFSALL